MQTLSLIGNLHFIAGGITLVAGFTALFATKGSQLHRFFGRVFVCFMLALTASGLLLSVQRDILFTVFLGLLTLYCFLTGWASVSRWYVAKWVCRLSPIMALTLCLGSVLGGIKAANSATGTLNDLPAGAFYFIAAVSFLCAVLDLSYWRQPTLSRKQKLIRHVWRMGFALFLSASIFFFGNNHVIPEALRTPLILSIPVLLVVAVTSIYIFWLALRPKFTRFRY